MRKVFLFFILGVFLFASEFTLLAKISAQGTIQTSDIKNDKVMFGVYKKVKIFDLEKLDVIKSLVFNNKVLKVRFYKDKLLILTTKKLQILDKNFNILNEYKGYSFKDFDIKNDILTLADYNNINIIDIRTSEKLASINTSPKIVRLSKDSQKLLTTTYYNMYVYNIKGEQLYSIKISNVKDAYWLNNNKIICNIKNGIYEINPIKSLKKLILNMKINAIFPLDEESLLLATSKIFYFNILNSKLVNLIDVNKEIYSIKLDKDKIIAQTSDNIYVFKLSSSKETSQSQEKKQKSIQEVKKPVKKPMLKIYVSQPNGIAPLKGKIKVYAFGDNIKAYYLNINGKEYIYKDGNKSFNYYFKKPGEYKVFAAIKDDNGNIISKTVTIKVREETFEDFKAKFR